MPHEVGQPREQQVRLVAEVAVEAAHRAAGASAIASTFTVSWMAGE